MYATPDFIWRVSVGNQLVETRPVEAFPHRNFASRAGTISCMFTACRKCSELGCAEGTEDSTGPLGSPSSGPCCTGDANSPGVLFWAILLGWWTGLSLHMQSNGPHTCPSFTLPKNAPVKMGLLCFCMFSSKLFTLKRLFLSKKHEEIGLWCVRGNFTSHGVFL